jgi:hypothetical protein
MACEDRTLKVDALWRVERIYRKQLVEEPGDTVARVSLAWCLFMQALHRAGQESTTPALLELPVSLDAVELEPDPRARERDSAHLLEDCLRQTLAVLQLSPNPRDRTDVERLQALVKLSGGEALLADAEEQARRVLLQLTREMMDGDAASARPYRRAPQRRPSDTA